MVFGSKIESNLLLEIAIKVSTLGFNFFKLFWAISIRLTPSKEKGIVTTAKVKAPRFLAISATTGEAPEQVPPPNPPAIKSISASLNICSISSLCSSAACLPTSGFMPAPNPLVKFRPIRSLR